MPSVDTYNVRNNLNKMIELSQPNNSKIDGIKKADEKAQQVIKDATSQNDEYKSRVNYLVDNNKSLLALRDSIIAIAKEYITTIDSNKVPFDVNSISAYCKDVVGNAEDEIASLEEKIKENSKQKADAEKIISDTPIRLSEEEQNRHDLKALIETALKDGEDLTKSRIRTTLDKLGEFNADEINAMLEAIMFPEHGLKAAHEDYEGKGKSTKDMLKEAIQNKDKPIENDIQSEVKNDPMALFNSKHEDEKKIKVIEQQPTKEVSNQEKKEFIMKAFNAEDIDIKFNPRILNYSLDELKLMQQKLEENNIDPKNINLRNLTSIDQFISSILEYKDNNYELDAQEITKNPYLDVVPSKRITNNARLAAQYGLTLRKATGKVAVEVGTRETSKLLKALNLIGGIDLSYFIVNPKNLAKIIGSTAARIYYCKQNGINYKKEDGSFESFIENENEFSELIGQVDTTIIPSAKECNKALTEILENPDLYQALSDYSKSLSYYDDIHLNDEQMERFKDICNQVDERSDKNVSYEIGFGKSVFAVGAFQKNLSYLLTLDADASDKDLIMCSLFFNAHKDMDEIKKIAREFDENTLRLAA